MGVQLVSIVELPALLNSILMSTTERLDDELSQGTFFSQKKFKVYFWLGLSIFFGFIADNLR